VGRDLRQDEIVLDDRYHAGTYGIPDASSAVSRDPDVGQTNGSTMMCAASSESRFHSGGQSEL
jgi:hypothetical protein